jgi:anti-anti-sigma regulatory factor
MTTQNRTLVVEQLPQVGSTKQAQAFLRQLKSSMSMKDPRVVLDCSQVRQMNAPLVYLLLCCLEETIKRNGDIKLAALPPAAMAVLNVTGVNRLFETYDTILEALNSFLEPRSSRPSQQIRSQQIMDGRLEYERESGAGCASAVEKMTVRSGGTNEKLGILATATNR